MCFWTQFSSDWSHMSEKPKNKQSVHVHTDMHIFLFWKAVRATFGSWRGHFTASTRVPVWILHASSTYLHDFKCIKPLILIKLLDSNKMTYNSFSSHLRSKSRNKRTANTKFTSYGNRFHSNSSFECIWADMKGEKTRYETLVLRIFGWIIHYTKSSENTFMFGMNI